MPHRKDPSLRDNQDLINETPWEMRIPAFRVFGNLYFVGNKDGASWILDTPEGPILFDSNYPTTDALLIHSMWSLGFNPEKLIAIIHTHGHYDHIGATDLLKSLSGAPTYLGAADTEMFSDRPELSYLDHVKNAYIELFDADVAVRDGDVFTIGGIQIRAVSTPGHCPGATSWFFPVTDGKRTFTAGLHGGAGFNTLVKAYREQYGVDWREDFFRSIEKLMGEKVDIFLGNHTAQNHTEEKAARLRAGQADAFVDPSEWQRFLEGLKTGLEKMIASEEREQSGSSREA